ncbi:MAG: SCO family protein [Xanthomonadaceae bacterium]|nr:SCO family protein [Xanthomonadaceae bacterium]
MDQPPRTHHKPICSPLNADAHPARHLHGSMLIPLLVVITAILVGLIVARSMFGQAAGFEAASMYPEARPIAPFELHDANGAAFTVDDLRGRYSLLFFGFTQCPDICPDTLSVLASSMDQLEIMRVENKPQVVFVSVDPARDDGQAMREYVGFFDPDFRAVTGDDEALVRLTSQVGAQFWRGAPDEGGFYTVDHSGMIVIIDPQGRMVGRFAQPLEPAAMAADLFTLSRMN